MEPARYPLRAARFLACAEASSLALPLLRPRPAAGFASPAEAFVDRKLDLNEHLVRDAAATFFVEVEGDSMEGVRIGEGDLLVVDRAREPKDGDVVVAAVDGEYLVKRLRLEGRGPRRRAFLESANAAYAPVYVGEGQDLRVFGVVTHAIVRL